MFRSTIINVLNLFLNVRFVGGKYWHVFFFRYNCEDKLCYQDLARLRGTKYFTWENKEKLDQQDEVLHWFYS